MSDRPTGAGSVMASRAEPPDALDFFPTPPWAARAGGELIQKLDPGPWNCWEPACGQGHMAHGLLDYFEAGVFSSDVYPYGYGSQFDFLTPDDRQRYHQFDWIVTNPPFNAAADFVRAAWPRARRGIAMLCRLQWLEGVDRHQLLYEECPLSVLAPFAERVPMAKGKWDPKGSTATAYAWFIWLSPGMRLGRARPVIKPIAPGAKVRLHQAGDVARFCAPPASPLLDGGGA